MGLSLIRLSTDNSLDVSATCNILFLFFLLFVYPDLSPSQHYLFVFFFFLFSSLLNFICAPFYTLFFVFFLYLLFFCSCPSSSLPSLLLFSLLRLSVFTYLLSSLLSFFSSSAYAHLSSSFHSSFSFLPVYIWSVSIFYLFSTFCSSSSFTFIYLPLYILFSTSPFTLIYLSLYILIFLFFPFLLSIYFNLSSSLQPSFFYFLFVSRLFLLLFWFLSKHFSPPNLFLYVSSSLFSLFPLLFSIFISILFSSTIISFSLHFPSSPTTSDFLFSF